MIKLIYLYVYHSCYERRVNYDVKHTSTGEMGMLVKQDKISILVKYFVFDYFVSPLNKYALCWFPFDCKIPLFFIEKDIYFFNWQIFLYF
jgi:hypothetical protein